MFKMKTPFAAGIAALAAIAITAGCASTDTSSKTAGKADYTKMSAEQLAEHLISTGFKSDMPVQEGGTVADRQVQDDLQKVCTATYNKPSPDQAGKIIAEARASIKYPERGLELGDWRKGRELAWSGFGFRVGHNNDDHSTREVGGNCYNCHQMGTDRVGGNIGPSLTGYGKMRNYSEASKRFAYEVMYNAHAYFPCTKMPRMGANGLLSESAMLDILAYLFDPNSHVNK